MKQSFEASTQPKETTLEQPPTLEELKSSVEALLRPGITEQDLAKVIERIRTRKLSNGEICYDADNIITYASNHEGVKYRRGDLVAYERLTPSGAEKGSAHITDMYR